MKETLLAGIDVPQENVHRMRGEIDPTEAAAEYREILKREFETITPCFDLVLLGVGDDGHTASIFPRTNAIEENHESVVAVFVPKLSTWRITLTLPVLNAAKNVMFIISGGSKSEIAKRVINGEQTTKELPVTLVRPKNGTLHWMLDSERRVLSGARLYFPIQIRQGDCAKPVRRQNLGDKILPGFLFHYQRCCLQQSLRFPDH